MGVSYISGVISLEQAANGEESTIFVPKVPQVVRTPKIHSPQISGFILVTDENQRFLGVFTLFWAVLDVELLHNY